MRGVSKGELARLSDGVVMMLRAWFDAPGVERMSFEGLPLREMVGGNLVVAALAALKASFLAARGVPTTRGGASSRKIILAAGPAFWLAARRWRQTARVSQGAAPGASQQEAPRSFLRGAPGASRGEAPDSFQRELSGASREGVIVALENYRNRVAFDQLEREGVALLRLQSSRENSYLPIPPRGEGWHRPAGEAWRAELSQRPLVEVEGLPSAPGWSAATVLNSFLLEEGTRALGPMLEEASAWRGWLRASRPRGILAGMPWGGGMRLLAFVARAAGLPYLAMQDGILSELGVGGFPPPASALAWGSAGKEWFVSRGLDPAAIALVGDPYLDAWVRTVSRIDRHVARRELGLPGTGRVVLCALQNSAPHTLVYDRNDPLRVAEGIAAALHGADGWHLAIKPHPRLRRVDGLSRLAEAWVLARRHGATLLPPDTDVAHAVAACDAYISDGDTLTVEVLSTGRPALLWLPPGHEPPQADYLDGSLPVVSTGAELLAQLCGDPLSVDSTDVERFARFSRGAIPGGESVLKRHLAAEEGLSAALARLM